MFDITEEQLNALIEEFRKKEHLKRERENKIDDQYMKWLDSYTKIHNRIDSEDGYYKQDISDWDRSNLKKLHDLFSEVNKYADISNIDCLIDDDNSFTDVYYNLINKDIGYEVRLSFGPQAVVFVERKDIVSFGNSYIDFKGISNNKVLKKV